MLLVHFIALYFYCMPTFDSFYLSTGIKISVSLETPNRIAEIMSQTLSLLSYSITTPPEENISQQSVHCSEICSYSASHLITHSSKRTALNWLGVCWVELVSKITLVSSKKRGWYSQAAVLLARLQFEQCEDSYILLHCICVCVWGRRDKAKNAG